ncbi:hypothetical protein BWQ96_06583 [Gracilariopsis chorda]|uniref:Uncharacterized protein n=1 Tax=Gracilariopsis chorda TaxID=448386 RepID=A0A2V3INM1_9FLOR|nr:hypothetical protein BWQ96_06583 [Gracilariopsis chorda]|eukprot:PXF43678.1 hypothetical protein BWQ96_06583 [Gracilariopsis chorda]
MRIDRSAGLPNPPPLFRSKLRAPARHRLPARRRFVSASPSSRPIQPFLRAWMDSTRNRPPARLEGNGTRAQATIPAVTNYQSLRDHPSDEELFAARVAALIKERYRLLRRGLIHRLQHLREAILLSESGQSAELAEALSSTSLALRHQSPAVQILQPSHALNVLFHDQRTANFVTPVHSPRRIRHSQTLAADTTTADLTVTSRAQLPTDTDAPESRQTQLSVDANVLATSQAQLSTGTNVPTTNQAQLSADTNVLVTSQAQLSADADVLGTRQAQLSADADVLGTRQAELSAKTSATGQAQLSADGDLAVTSQAQLPTALSVPSSSQTQLPVEKNVPAIKSILVGSPRRNANRPKRARRVSFAINADRSDRVAERTPPSDVSMTDSGFVGLHASLAKSLSRALSAIKADTADGGAAEGALPCAAGTFGVGSANVDSQEQPQEVICDEQMHFGDSLPSPYRTDKSRDMPLDPTSRPDRERGQIQPSPLLPSAGNVEFRWSKGVDSAARSHQPHESKYIPSTTLAERVDASGSTGALSYTHPPQTNSGGVSQSLPRPETGLTKAQDHIVSGQSVSGILPCELHLLAQYLSEAATPLTIDRLPFPPVPQNNPETAENVARSNGRQLHRTAEHLTKLLQSDVQPTKRRVGHDSPVSTSSGSSHGPLPQAVLDRSDSQSTLQARKLALRAYRSASPNGSRSFLDNLHGTAHLSAHFFDQELHELFDEKFRLTHAPREQSMIKATALCEQFPSPKSERQSPTSLIKGLVNRTGPLFSLSEPDAHLHYSTTCTHRSDKSQHASSLSNSEPHTIFPSSLYNSEISELSPFIRDLPPGRRDVTESPLPSESKNGIQELPAVGRSSSVNNFQRRTYLNMSELDERRYATAAWQPDITCYTPLSNGLIQPSGQRQSSHVAYAFASNKRAHSYHTGRAVHCAPTDTTTALNFGFQRRTNYPFRTTHRKQPTPVGRGADEPLSSAAETALSSNATLSPAAETALSSNATLSPAAETALSSNATLSPAGETALSSNATLDGLTPFDILRFAHQCITDYRSNDKDKTEQIYSIGNDGKLTR